MASADQNSNSEFKIIVYSPESRPSFNLGDTEIHYLNSTQYDRWDAFKLYSDSWLCFFDQDCALTEALINSVKQILRTQDHSTVLCGRYQNSAQAPLKVRAYNFICNTWLEAGLQLNEPRLLGGFFAVYNSFQLRSVAFERGHAWGGEDFRLALKLAQYDYRFTLAADLFVTHQPRHHMKWFVTRAFIQGKNSPNSKNKNYSYIFSQIFKQGLPTGILAFVHFIFVKIGWLFNGAEVSNISGSVFQKDYLNHKSQ